VAAKFGKFTIHNRNGAIEMSKRKSAVAEPPTSVVGRVLDDLNACAEAAEEILWSLSPGDLPTSAQRNVLRLVGIITRDDVDGELGRVAGVKEKLAEAGSVSEFREAEEAAFDARREENEQKPALEEQKAAIEAQLVALAKARAEAEARIDTMRSAREALRSMQLLPRHVRDAYQTDLSVVQTKHGRRRRELQSELALLDGLQKLFPGGDLNGLDFRQQRMLHAEAAAPELISRQQNGKAVIDDDDWRDYVARRESRRKAIEGELAKVEDLIRSDGYAGEQLRNYYLDRRLK
jgi:hypothetical protein